MVSVAIIGPAQDKRIFSLLHRVLGQEGRILALSPRGLSADAGTPDFLIWDTSRPGGIEAPGGLIIFKEKATDFEGMLPPVCGMAVVGSDNPAAIEFLAASKQPAITCGLSPRDTITLSSMTDGSVMVAIQRSIPAFDGTAIEPVELPVRLSAPADSYSILCAAATLAYSGRLHNRVELVL